jgi:IMP cyclohydrolase
MTAIERLAQENLQALACNKYPGRIIVMGRAPNGSSVQIYGIMGRSEGSRNRILEKIEGEHGRLQTRVADESQVTGDPALLIYTAMAEKPGTYVVSNGAQTDTVIQGGILTLKDSWQYEPDAPNYTPRITGVINYIRGHKPPEIRLVILKKSLFGDRCDCMSYDYGEIRLGYGHCISTYEGDGDPLPPFCGEPLLLPIGINAKQIAEQYWTALNEHNRVALAVKFIPSDQPSSIYIINRHTS